MRPRSRVAAALLALVTASTALTAAAPATAAPGPRPVPPGAGPERPGAPLLVTLITGDRVRASPLAGGGWQLSLEPGATSSSRQFQAEREGRTDWYLVPQPAEQALAAGLLDRELFNITGLIRQGYHDAQRDTLPLLVQHQDAATGRAAELSGASVRRQFPELDFSAVEARKGAAAEFWRQLSTARSGGVRKVWLDAQVRKSLDTSVPQVGAPAAWQSGFTGKGVTVAVLDTGIDDTHPDVAGKVKHSKDFSGKGNVTDGDGHGTHVAATAAGSGAAAGGRFKGVAPEADLAVGKVLNDFGGGPSSATMAGMEWAAAEVKAKIVSMSLGYGTTDGDDPLAQAVNTLSRKHGTLFVAAAGNWSTPVSVSTPASADLALSVASLTKHGVRSDFSSQGPRRGNGAVKPEISAPGSDIVAARATGTGEGAPGNDRYTAMSGTSMATPHVAGGAAILAQQHPDWNHEQLKAALVATAKPVADTGVFAVGSGQLDLAKATGNTVQSTPAAHNVFLKWPSTKAEDRVVTYTNRGSTPITLNLALELADSKGIPAPAGLAKLSANTVTVPAGGKATASVSLIPRAAAAGSYGGTLTATGGGSTLRTLIGAHEEGEHYDVSAKVLRRDGVPATDGQAELWLTRHLDGAQFPIPLTGTARVPAGDYLATGVVRTPKADGGTALSTVANPQVRVAKATAVQFDARLATPVKVSTDQPTLRGGAWNSVMQHRAVQHGRTASWQQRLDPRSADFSSYSTAGASSDTFGYANVLRLEEPGVELFGEGAKREEFQASWLYYGSAPQPLDLKSAPSVFAGGGTAAELAEADAKGKIVALSLPATTPGEERVRRIDNVKQAGGLAVAMHITSGSAVAQARDTPAVLPGVWLNDEQGARLVAHVKAGGRLSLRLRADTAHRYHLVFPATGKVPAKQEHSVRAAELAAVTMVHHMPPGEQGHRMGASARVLGGLLGTSAAVVPVAGERVEHFTPGSWDLSVGGANDYGPELSGRQLVQAGKSYRQEWNKAVFGPSFAGTTSTELGDDHPWVWEKGNLLDVSIPWWSDAAGHTRSSTRFGEDKGSTALYVDNVEVGRHQTPGRGVFPIGGGAMRRLESEVTREAPGWRGPTKMIGKWTFDMPYGAPVLPLLNIRYAPPVDTRNLAPGDREFTIPVTAPRQDAPARAASLSVEYSTDDGASWQQARVEPAGAGWNVTVRNPASGFVSLRGKASDGVNAVELTTVRAYEIG